MRKVCAIDERLNLERATTIITKRSAQPFRLIAWNIRAGGGQRAAHIVDWLVAQRPTVVMLSEFRGTPPSRQIAAGLHDHGYLYQRHTVDAAAPARNSLLIAARTPLRLLSLRHKPTEPGRWCAVRTATQPPLALACVHIPNQHTGRKPHFHQAVLQLMQRWRGGPMIIAGDTNSGRQGEDEQTPVFNAATSAWFDQIEQAGWRDAFRMAHGAKAEYTWYSPGHDNGFRLDQAFLSPDLARCLRNVQHVWAPHPQHVDRRDGLSDHAALLVDLSL